MKKIYTLALAAVIAFSASPALATQSIDTCALNGSSIECSGTCNTGADDPTVFLCLDTDLEAQICEEVDAIASVECVNDVWTLSGDDLENGTYLPIARHQFQMGENWIPLSMVYSSTFTVNIAEPFAMSPEVLAGGFISNLGDFAGDFGPIVGIILVGALGLFGVKLGWGILTTYIRTRKAKGE